jgi:hypothetical protein
VYKKIYCFRGTRNKLEIFVGVSSPNPPFPGRGSRALLCTQEKRETLLDDQEQFTTGARTTLLVSQEGLTGTQEHYINEIRTEPRTPLLENPE